jgi:hypothetical protein
MARDDYGNRGRDRDFGQDQDRERDLEGARDSHRGPSYGQSRGAPGDRYSSSGDERDVGYAGERDDSRRAREAREARSERSWGDPRDDQRYSGQGGVGGGMGREGGGRYAGRPEDDARAMRFDRDSDPREHGWDRAEQQRYEEWRSASYREAREREPYYHQGESRDARDVRDLQYGLQNGDTMRDMREGRDRGASHLHGPSANRPGNMRDLMDRNPGQGFGAFGYSNADERGDRVPSASTWSGRATGDRDYTGRGPRAYRRSDERIREDVCERLTMHREIDASDVDIDVREGVVTLTGKVEDKHAKRLAEDVAEEVMGVVDVRNELQTERRGFLGGLFGHHEHERGADRELARDATRDADRASATDASRSAATGELAGDEVNRSIGAASTGPTGATGTAGVPRPTREI